MHPTLLVFAAGRDSRYGCLKPLGFIGPCGAGSALPFAGRRLDVACREDREPVIASLREMVEHGLNKTPPWNRAK